MPASPRELLPPHPVAIPVRSGSRRRVARGRERAAVVVHVRIRLHGVERPRSALFRSHGALRRHRPGVVVQARRLLDVAVAVPRRVVVSPSVNAMFSELALPRFAWITAQNASSATTAQRRGVLLRVAIRQPVQDDKNKKLGIRGAAHVVEQVVLSWCCSPRRTLLKSVMSPLCMNMYRPLKNGWQLYWCTLAPGPARRTCPKSNDERMAFERAQVAVVARRRHRGVHRGAVVRVQAEFVHQPAPLARASTRCRTRARSRGGSPVVHLAPGGVSGALRTRRDETGRASRARERRRRGVGRESAEGARDGGPEAPSRGRRRDGAGRRERSTDGDPLGRASVFSGQISGDFRGSGRWCVASAYLGHRGEAMRGAEDELRYTPPRRSKRSSGT